MILKVRDEQGKFQNIPSIIGPAGSDGKDGYTPQKGIDYFTEDDKQELINEMHLENYVTTEEAEQTYATKDEIPNLEDYYTKEETDEAIANAITGGTVDLKDYLKKAEAQETYETKIEHKADLNKKVDAVIENEKGTAAILNNETGGQLLYLNNENNVRANISVNDGSSNVYAQLSVTDKDTNIGARIDVNNEKAYYTTGKDTPEFSDDDELLTKKDAYTKIEADEKFLTEHQDLSAYATNIGVDNKLENYYNKDASDERFANKDYSYSKADIDGKFAEAAAGGQITLDGYLKIEDADKKFATQENLGGYVQQRVVGNKGIALISNDPTGGLLKFTSNTGEEMGVAVNDGSEDIYVQMYAKNAETGEGTRLTLNKGHAYVKTSNDHAFDENDIVVVKNDLNEYYTKQEIEDKNYLTKHQDISNLATKDEVELKANKTDLDSYLKTDVANTTYAKVETLQNYETAEHAAETYALKSNIPSLDGYLTTDAADKKFITEEQLNSAIEKAITKVLEGEY